MHFQKKVSITLVTMKRISVLVIKNEDVCDKIIRDMLIEVCVFSSQKLRWFSLIYKQWSFVVVQPHSKLAYSEVTVTDLNRNCSQTGMRKTSFTA